MLPLVEFPELVEHYAPFFKGIFTAAAILNSSATSTVWLC